MSEIDKALVLEAFDTLFNRRDYEAAARFWSRKFTAPLNPSICPIEDTLPP